MGSGKIAAPLSLRLTKLPAPIAFLEHICVLLD